jgi:hypothetical protein
LKKELNGGVVVGILVALGLVVIVLAWKAIAPPAPAGIKPFDKAELEVMKKKHAESAQEISQKQAQMFQQAHGGGR